MIINQAIKKLGDVYDVRDGTHDSPKYQPTGYALVTSKNLKNGRLNFDKINYISKEDAISINQRSAVHKGDVLFAMIGTIGNPVVVDNEPDFCIKNVALFKVPENQDCYFLKYYLDSPYVISKMNNEAKGTTQRFVGLGYLRDFPIPIPPLPEQKRIVAILDEAFAGISQAIANTEKNLANACELFQSGYIAIFDEALANGYQNKTVAEVAHSTKGSMRTGPFGSQLLHGEFVDEGIAVLGIDNAVNNQFRWDKRRYITEEKYKELSRYRVKPGDILITIMGTCGRCAVIPDDIPTAINTKHLCCITLDTGKCMSWFLHGYFLHHPVAQQFLASKAKGSIMAGLNMGIISDLPILLPPLNQQRNIVTKVDYLHTATERLKTIYNQKLKALAELKQSILQKAFTGELTQDLPL